MASTLSSTYIYLFPTQCVVLYTAWKRRAFPKKNVFFVYIYMGSAFAQQFNHFDERPDKLTRTGNAIKIPLHTFAAPNNTHFANAFLIYGAAHDDTSVSAEYGGGDSAS